MILLEILIALSLTAILLTFLFSFFVESAKIEKKLDQARMATSARTHLQTRLQNILSSISIGVADGSLYTKQFEKEKFPSLVTIFDNGIDPDPAYSGSITGRIYLDEEKNLCLATWPLDENKNRPWRKEILLSHIDGFEFEFLGKKSATEHGKKEKIKPITPNLAWRTAWPKTPEEVPSIIRLSVQQKKQNLYFAFLLPSSEPFVTYEERKAL